ncbi:MAG TPA: hypothetical protein PLB32_07050, partial [Acidobacteriota bacterium]|nr:hypothetical protein [Acidobacteriota bacterium]
MTLTHTSNLKSKQNSGKLKLYLEYIFSELSQSSFSAPVRESKAANRFHFQIWPGIMPQNPQIKGISQPMTDWLQREIILSPKP